MQIKKGGENGEPKYKAYLNQAIWWGCRRTWCRNRYQNCQIWPKKSRKFMRTWNWNCLGGGGNLWRGNLLLKQGWIRVQADYRDAQYMHERSCDGWFATTSWRGYPCSNCDCYATSCRTIYPWSLPFVTLKKIGSWSLVRGSSSPYFVNRYDRSPSCVRLKQMPFSYSKMGSMVFTMLIRKRCFSCEIWELTHRDVISKGLRIMDSTASTLSMDNDIDLVVFNMNEPGNTKRVVFGENSSTTVSNNGEK